MTYCLGWKTETCAYLIADAAVTSPAAPSKLRSSFGEAHISGTANNVEEGALKIISAGSAGITFSGDASIGYPFVDAFRYAIDLGVEPKAALERTILSVNVHQDTPLSVLCAFGDRNGPHLLSFNAKHDGCIVDHVGRDLIQLGSLVGSDQEFITRISDDFIQWMKNTNLEGPDHLACTLGMCQSYGLHNNLLRNGVGGTFSGAFVDKTGFHCQPDILYLLFMPGDNSTGMDGIFAFNRSNVLIVQSILDDGPARIFVTSEQTEPQDKTVERARDVYEQSLSAMHRLDFDYLSFLNTLAPRLAVLEMNNNKEHRYAIIECQSIKFSGNTATLGILFSPDLHRFLNGDCHADGRPKRDISTVPTPELLFSKFAPPDTQQS